jgi:hypothetical protein
MNSRNDRYTIEFAGPQHGQQLLRVYESGEFAGKVSLAYTRRPDPYQSLMLEGEEVLIPIVVDRRENVVCGMGACVIRKVNLNGTKKTAGYLTGMKSLPEYRRRIPNGAAVYQQLFQRLRDRVDFYYTTILSDNLSAQKMLEKKRRNMPEYHHLGEYKVFCFATGTAQRLTRENRYDTLILGKCKLDEVASLFSSTAGQFNLSPGEMKWHGLSDSDCFSLRGQDGTILAACAVWNRQETKQYIVNGYGGIYRYLRRLPLTLFGYPNLPKENEPLNHASVSMLFVRGLDSALAAHFLKLVAAACGDYDLLMVGFFENHPLASSMSRIRAFRYSSRLYAVNPDDRTLTLDGRPIQLEVALL